jgi:hypothetical protein
MLYVDFVRRKSPTASLMRNDLLNTARRACIEERKDYKDAQETTKATKNRGHLAKQC